MEAKVESAFPDRPQFQGFMKPCRMEGEIQALEIHGNIPKDIDGTFYRVMPDPQLPPFVQDDPWFNGDGNIAAFTIKDGSVSFRQRYVRTEKFTREREAKRALLGMLPLFTLNQCFILNKCLTFRNYLGKYRNKFTDAVEFKIRSTANTNVVYFNGQLLALKEDAPHTHSILPPWKPKGQLPSLTFTAHPKFDPKTGEMVCFGYEAKGDGTPDVCYYSVSPDGKFTEVVCDVERMKQGGEHWQWSPETPFYLGVLPRRGAKPTDVKWFEYKNSFPGHTVNAYEDKNGNISLDLGLSDKNVFFWWPDAQGNAPEPSSILSQLVRFTFDPTSKELNLPSPQLLQKDNTEFYRIDDRFATKPHRHCFMDLMDPSLGTDFQAIGPRLGGGYPLYNSLAHLDVITGKTEIYFPGKTHMVQEPVFIPRRGSEIEGDGYLLALVNNYDTMSSELHMLDTKDFTRVQAIVLLPIRLRQGLHGNWVDALDLKAAV
ncbi:uncharacterized protein N7458_008917 [Penicillium daleae]|uniref:Lignostilbene dioxygenase n=1 Tax=Penicillium daleae TaxID=63821 RepID=A0AAD6BYS1_9EURO|nr:uncharacterized protein N7458_008917 [Penicillium daleae]KAJ5437919.1 hypothetical protein N7458_008917 [Penicillium daleae]